MRVGFIAIGAKECYTTIHMLMLCAYQSGMLVMSCTSIETCLVTLQFREDYRTEDYEQV